MKRIIYEYHYIKDGKSLVTLSYIKLSGFIKIHKVDPRTYIEVIPFKQTKIDRKRDL
jgi:hypothetical protein